MAGRTIRQSNLEPQRRSSRLNNRQPLANGAGSSGNAKKREIVHVELPQKKRRKVEPKPSTSGSSQNCNLETTSSQVIIPRRSQRITPPDLIKREQELLKKEQAYQQKIGDLEAKNLSLSTKVEESSVLISEMKKREAEAALAQLEEHFTCPLCYEIMSHPYSLNPGQCGHTFCALCIIKWFFSRLHRQCGGWHESVDCPICRSLLVITPERAPRLDVTFPFVPNRLAATLCESLIEKLGQSPSGCSMTVKREDSEGVWSLERSRKKGQTKKEESEDEDEESSKLVEWRPGGDLRIEWQKRDKDGRKEMSYLLERWTNMQASDFIATKHRLGV
ncbi:ring finger domain-containing protein [Moniliophthora roreri MCA 2997]|uniref:Ring finger domain-containing protein n=2 Tax=Moniliophthora roreri TaxID=221103 RepID=V2XZ51_MONRO|nr:ring finger domain-containing protein [Moniliophthora roreri MCA 2997]KAI3602657.1 ring finger domain-containing protein [Moniliophthora roreri]